MDLAKQCDGHKTHQCHYARCIISLPLFITFLIAVLVYDRWWYSQTPAYSLLLYLRRSAGIPHNFWFGFSSALLVHAVVP